MIDHSEGLGGRGRGGKAWHKDDISTKSGVFSFYGKILHLKMKHNLLRDVVLGCFSASRKKNVSVACIQMYEYTSPGLKSMGRGVYRDEFSARCTAACLCRAKSYRRSVDHLNISPGYHQIHLTQLFTAKPPGPMQTLSSFLHPSLSTVH